MTLEEHAEQLAAEDRILNSLTEQARTAIQSESISELGATWLRKRFHTDYRTAVHLIDRLEQAGDIGPASDARLRPVLTGGFSIFA